MTSIRYKIWTTLMLMLCVAQGVGAKAINTKNLSIAPGQTREFYIYMNTSVSNMVAFQIDLELPEGLTVNVDKCALTSRILDKEQELFVGEVGTRVYRLVSASYNLTYLTKEDDTLVKVSVTASDTFKGGTVKLTNMVTATAASAKSGWKEDNFLVTAVKNEKGDIDYNGKVDITDAMLIVDYVLDDEALYQSNMDVNGDRKIDVSDTMEVVDLILNQE